MKAIIDIIDQAGGWRSDLSLRIENPPYIPLFVEALDDRGPLGLPALSVAHYTEQSGNLMRHPEMCFELETTLEGELTLIPIDGVTTSLQRNNPAGSSCKENTYFYRTSTSVTFASQLNGTRSLRIEASQKPLQHNARVENLLNRQTSGAAGLGDSDRRQSVSNGDVAMRSGTGGTAEYTSLALQQQ